MFMNYSFADTMSCEKGTSSIGGDYTVPPVNITAPNDGESSKLLYSVNKAVIQPAYTNCTVGAINWVNTAHTLIDVPPRRYIHD